MELYKAKNRKGTSFVMSHCWTTLRHSQKFISKCNEITQKSLVRKKSITASPHPSTLGIDEVRDDDIVETAPNPVGRPAGKKTEKERQRRGKRTSDGGDLLCTEVIDNFWVKKREIEEMKEMRKKERHVERIKAEKERNDETLAMERKKLELREKEFALKSRIEDDKVMNMDLSGMGERQQRYYMMLQDEILAQRCGDSA